MKLSSKPTNTIIVKVYPDISFKKFNFGVDFAIITLKDDFFDWVKRKLKLLFSIEEKSKGEDFIKFSFIENKSVTKFYIDDEQKTYTSPLENYKQWSFVEFSEEDEEYFLRAEKNSYSNQFVFNINTNLNEYYSFYSFYIKAIKKITDESIYTWPIPMGDLLDYDLVHELQFKIENSYLENSYIALEKVKNKAQKGSF